MHAIIDPIGGFTVAAPEAKAVQAVPLQNSINFDVELYRCCPSLVELQVDDVFPKFHLPGNIEPCRRNIHTNSNISRIENHQTIRSGGQIIDRE